jgi:hypothetical protein
MIISLLVLILLTLLFGAAAVKGWLANVVGAALGLALLIVAGIWVNIYFGEYGFIAVCIGLLLLFVGLKAWVDSGPV